jgi:hypothetical protein|tara:strand:+ start:219 stop:944 length:726 start_codon:yes stop_codon:yes gene_type:complete
MAISVDTVYKTVLLILNKEQRGYMTPDEFNKIGSQVQREIFEAYFEDLNQQLRVPQTDMDYANRVAVTDEKIAEFKTENDQTVAEKTIGGTNPFTTPPELYRLGSFTYEPTSGDPVEIQRLTRGEYYNINKSPLTKPSKSFPIYLYEDNKAIVYPTTINSASEVKMQYLKKPTDVKWAFTTGSLGQLVFDSANAIDFELHNSERTEVVLKVLLYQGVVIRDPQIVQVAAQKVQQEEVNEKS